MQSCLTERKPWTKINQADSFWDEMLFGVPQRSALNPILFAHFIMNFASYADDYTIYNAGHNIDEASHILLARIV